MIRMLSYWLLLWHLVQRRLCEEIDFNLAYRWFCRSG